MLRKLSANDPRFKVFTFKDNLNLVVADRTPKSLETDSRNSAGKSSIIELFHFLLGARVDNRSLAQRKALRNITFSLALDWPTLDQSLEVGRRGSEPGLVSLSERVVDNSDQLALGLEEISIGDVKR
jgi:uncharacterized protein YydD (DUF2326 family)